MTESDPRPQTRARSDQPLKELPQRERVTRLKRTAKPIIEPTSDNVSNADSSTATLGRALQKGKEAEEVESDGDHEGDITDNDAKTQSESNITNDIEALTQKIERLEKEVKLMKLKQRAVELEA
jgi:hypothetical protein